MPGLKNSDSDAAAVVATGAVRPIARLPKALRRPNDCNTSTFSSRRRARHMTDRYRTDHASAYNAVEH